MSRVHLGLVLTSILAIGCGGGSSGSKDASAPDDINSSCSGGPAPGDTDVHCQGDGGLVVNTVDPNACGTSGGNNPADYGDTMYNAQGRDDDCKYVVSYTVDPICEDEGVYFTVVAKSASDGSAVTGAKTRLEAFLTDTHPAPNSGSTTTEPTPGTYRIGPVKFDAAGKWTARFHFFEDCADADGSPHGHAAFFVNVP